MSDLKQIIDRAVPPVPFDEGDNIPWNEPEFSERMLKEHLNQDHDLASRKIDTIAEDARWIFAGLLGSRPGRVLDLACGPGLYSGALARLGCECVGVDFSPASISYAEETAREHGLTCSYRLADVRDGGFGNGFDLVMMLYGQINVFERAQAREIVAGMVEALEPGGRLLLEPQAFAHVRADGQQTSSWYTAQSGLFSAEPHLVLQEGYWDEESRTRTERFFVIDAGTGSVERHSLPTVAYEDDELEQLLVEAGLEDVRSQPCDDGASIRLIVGRKPGR